MMLSVQLDVARYYARRVVAEAGRDIAAAGEEAGQTNGVSTAKGTRDGGSDCGLGGSWSSVVVDGSGSNRDNGRRELQRVTSGWVK